MTTLISFRGTAVLTTVNGADWSIVPDPILRELAILPPPQGDGEYIKELGKHGADVVLALKYRVLDGGLDELVSLWEGLGGLPRGTLVAPGWSLERCIVTAAKPGKPERRRLAAGLGWLQDWTVTFRRSA